MALQIGDVRDNQVDSQHIVGWKSQTAVHDDDAVITLKRGNVHADLIESAERNDLNTAVLLHLYFIRLLSSAAAVVSAGALMLFRHLHDCSGCRCRCTHHVLMCLGFSCASSPCGAPLRCRCLFLHRTVRCRTLQSNRAFGVLRVLSARRGWASPSAMGRTLRRLAGRKLCMIYFFYFFYFCCLLSGSVFMISQSLYLLLPGAQKKSASMLRIPDHLQTRSLPLHPPGRKRPS